MKRIFTLLVTILMCQTILAQSTLVGFDVSALTGGNGNYGPSPLPPTTSATNATVTGLVRGSGVGTTGTGAQRAWGGVGFNYTNAADAITGNAFFTTSVTANANYLSSFSSIDYNYRRSATGPGSALIQYQLGTSSFVDITTVTFTSTSSSGSTLSPIDLSGITQLQTVGAGIQVTFRIVPYGATSAAGSSYIFDVANSTALDFAITGSLQFVAPLSVSELNAAKQGSSVNLGWILGCSSNEVTYSVERSANGVSFGALDSKTVSRERCDQPFQFVDNSPLKGTNYYRVKSSNIDGELKYSQIAQVKFAGTAAGIKVFPTLTTGAATIYVETAEAGKASFQVMDMNGRVVKTMNVSLVNGANNIQLNVANLAAGKYLVQGIIGNEKTSVVSVVKQ